MFCRMMLTNPIIKQFTRVDSKTQKLIISIKTFIGNIHLGPIYVGKTNYHLTVFLID
jgi:hypothetical protein